MAKAISVGRKKRSTPANAGIPGSSPKIADLLAMPGAEEIELEIPRFEDRARPADLS